MMHFSKSHLSDITFLAYHFLLLLAAVKEKKSTVQYFVLDTMVQNCLLKRSELSFCERQRRECQTKGPILSIQNYSV